MYVKKNIMSKAIYIEMNIIIKTLHNHGSINNLLIFFLTKKINQWDVSEFRGCVWVAEFDLDAHTHTFFKCR